MVWSRPCKLGGRCVSTNHQRPPSHNAPVLFVLGRYDARLLPRTKRDRDVDFESRTSQSQRASELGSELALRIRALHGCEPRSLSQVTMPLFQQRTTATFSQAHSQRSGEFGSECVGRIRERQTGSEVAGSVHVIFRSLQHDLIVRDQKQQLAPSGRPFTVS